MITGSNKAGGRVPTMFNLVVKLSIQVKSRLESLLPSPTITLTLSLQAQRDKKWAWPAVKAAPNRPRDPRGGDNLKDADEVQERSRLS